MAGDHHESAEGPSAPGAAGDERRAALRHMAVLRVAVLIRGESRQLCLVRNISAGGLKARIFSEIAPGEPVALELKTGQPLAGRIVWARDGHAGIQFDEDVSVGDALAPPSLRSGWRARLPRLAVDRLAMIRSGADISFASTCDISQGGVRVLCDRPLARGAEVVLTLEGFRPLEGVVRWERDGCCGISFNQIIPPGDLSRWLAS